jgi:hypothetical protein
MDARAHSSRFGFKRFEVVREIVESGVPDGTCLIAHHFEFWNGADGRAALGDQAAWKFGERRLQSRIGEGSAGIFAEGRG